MIGTATFSVVARDSMHDIFHHFISYEVKITEQPHPDNGAEGPLSAMTIADPDDNVINVVVYQNK